MTESESPIPAETAYEHILVEQRGRVGIITLNRPKQLNALNARLAEEVLAAGRSFDRDTGIGAILLTGSERAFAAGADISEFAEYSSAELQVQDVFGGWDEFAALRTPVIAAVAGYALGGGSELALLSDIVIAAETAVFGQPEIKLGLIPGIGGTQRLTRAVGKAVASDIVLTGRNLTAQEALQFGIVSRVVPADELFDTALSVADTVAGYSLPAVYAAKAAIHAAHETTLHEGLRAERLAFNALFALEDQKEGVAAFLEKRQADFKHR